jgi:hypothetical protein
LRTRCTGNGTYSINGDVPVSSVRLYPLVLTFALGL